MNLLFLSQSLSVVTFRCVHCPLTCTATLISTVIAGGDQELMLSAIIIAAFQLLLGIDKRLNCVSFHCSYVPLLECPAGKQFQFSYPINQSEREMMQLPVSICEIAFTHCVCIHNEYNIIQVDYHRSMPTICNNCSQVMYLCKYLQ